MPVDANVTFAEGAINHAPTKDIGTSMHNDTSRRGAIHCALFNSDLNKSEDRVSIEQFSHYN
jgi:hypothetical protein